VLRLVLQVFEARGAYGECRGGFRRFKQIDFAASQSPSGSYGPWRSSSRGVPGKLVLNTWSASKSSGISRRPMRCSRQPTHRPRCRRRHLLMPPPAAHAHCARPALWFEPMGRLVAQPAIALRQQRARRGCSVPAGSPLGSSHILAFCEAAASY
jgi:hypothetical protein